jgi:hypothetical protein
MEALQRVKLNGFDVVIAELEVELDLVRRATRYLEERKELVNSFRRGQHVKGLARELDINESFPDKSGCHHAGEISTQGAIPTMLSPAAPRINLHLLQIPPPWGH